MCFFHSRFFSLNKSSISRRYLNCSSVSSSSYNIVATSSANGSITPSGTSSYDCGTNATYTISPSSAAYQIDSLVVNGVKVSNPGSSYTFTNITSNGTISVYFGLATCTNAPTATAPGAASICSGLTYALNGSYGGGATAATWSTSGSGTFNNTAVGTGTIYTPSAADIAAGSVTLTITTNDPDGVGPCVPAIATTILTIKATPALSISGSTSICAGTSTTLTASGASTYSWSSGQSTAAITVNTAGTYTVTGTG